MDLNEFTISDFIGNLFSDKNNGSAENTAASELIDNLYKENNSKSENNNAVTAEFIDNLFSGNNNKSAYKIGVSELIDNLYNENNSKSADDNAVTSDYISNLFGDNIDKSAYNNLVLDFTADLQNDNTAKSDDNNCWNFAEDLPGDDAYDYSSEEIENEGIYTCSVCNTKNNTLICANCGFDSSCDYEKYSTLQKIAENTPSLSYLKAKIKSPSQQSVKKVVALLKTQKWDNSVIYAVENILNRALNTLPAEPNGKGVKTVFGIGDTVILGVYPQEMLKTPTGIEWEVIDVSGNKALLLSKKCLDARPYETIKSETKWPYSSLRRWLNYDFFNEAFNAQAKTAIIETMIPDSFNPRSNVNCETTTDKVFILSREELAKYNLSKDKITCKPTKHAINNGVFCDVETSNAYWWLRTPGYSAVSAMYVMGNGTQDELGYNIDSANKGVRPAIWVDMAKLKA